ncbi:MAG: hypothetical protein ACAI34_12005 [Verrucomicrobium sp.]|nr:hypothetical protein [Verrucomicrobium sp.]
MKIALFLFSAASSISMLAGCASSDPTSSGLPEAAHREEARRYGTSTPLSTDPSSPLKDVSTNKGQVSLKAAEF